MLSFCFAMKACFIFRSPLYFCADFVVFVMLCFVLFLHRCWTSATALPWENEHYVDSSLKSSWHRHLGVPHQCSSAFLRPRRHPVPRCRWCVEDPLASVHESGRPRPPPPQRPDKAGSSYTTGGGITPQRPLNVGTSDTADGRSQVTPVRPRDA